MWAAELFSIKREIAELGVVAHTFSPSTWEAEAGGYMSSRPTSKQSDCVEKPSLEKDK